MGIHMTTDGAEGRARAPTIAKGCKVAESFTCEARAKWASPTTEILIDNRPAGEPSIEAVTFRQQYSI